MTTLVFIDQSGRKYRVIANTIKRDRKGKPETPLDMAQYALKRLNKAPAWVGYTPPKTTQKQRDRCITNQAGSCWLCGLGLGRDITIEHLKPKCKGGKLNDDNAVVCHAACNRFLGVRPIFEKLEMRKQVRRRMVEVLQRLELKQ